MSERTRRDKFDLRLDPGESKALRVLAKQCGMSKSEFLRFVIRNGSVPPLRKLPLVRS